MKLYRRHIASGAFDNAAEYPSGAPFEAGEGFEWVEGEPTDDAVVYREKPLDVQVSEMYGSLPIDLQAKYAQEIVASEVFFRRKNYMMLLVLTQQAQTKLDLPDDQPVADIVTFVLAKLQELVQ